MKFLLLLPILQHLPNLASAIQCYSCQPVMYASNKSCRVITCAKPTDQCYYGQLQTSPGDKKSTIWWSGCHTPSRNDKQALEQQCTVDNYFSICKDNLCNVMPQFGSWPPQVSPDSIKYEVKRSGDNDVISLNWDTENHCKKFWFSIEYTEKFGNTQNLKKGKIIERSAQTFTETVKNSRSITLKNLKKEQIYQISITTQAPNGHSSEPFVFEVTLKNPSLLLSVSGFDSSNKVKKSVQGVCSSHSVVGVDGTIRPKPDSKYCVLQHRNSKLFWGECKKQEKKQFRIVQGNGDRVYIQTVDSDLCWTINPYASRSQLIILKQCKYDSSQGFSLGSNMVWVESNGNEKFCVPFEAGKKLATKQCFPENDMKKKNDKKKNGGGN